MATKEVKIAVDETTARQFKSRCADYGVTMSSVLRPAMEEFLRTRPPILPKKPQVD